VIPAGPWRWPPPVCPDQPHSHHRPAAPVDRHRADGRRHGPGPGAGQRVDDVVLPVEQSGVGSAVNDTIQEFGGSLGVAVIGSIVSRPTARTCTRATSRPPCCITPPARSSRLRDGRPHAAAGHADHERRPRCLHQRDGHRLHRGRRVAAIAALGLSFALPRRVVPASETLEAWPPFYRPSSAGAAHPADLAGQRLRQIVTNSMRRG